QLRVGSGDQNARWLCAQGFFERLLLGCRIIRVRPHEFVPDLQISCPLRESQRRSLPVGHLHVRRYEKIFLFRTVPAATTQQRRNDTQQKYERCLWRSHRVLLRATDVAQQICATDSKRDSSKIELLGAFYCRALSRVEEITDSSTSPALS